MRYQWWIHGHINFVLLSSSAFCDLYDEVMQPEETTEAYQTLQGFHTRSVDVSRGLWDAQPDREGQPDADGAVRRRSRRPRCWPRSTRQTMAARSASQLDAFLDEFGWRSDAVYDLADIPWREDPSIAAVEHRRLRRPRRQPRIPSCCTGRRSASARSCWPRPGRSWPTIPTRWRSSRSSTRRPATASRSPRTMPSTSTSSASACSGGSRWPSATASCRRA